MRYYVAGMAYYSNYLAHHGIKGQKWGVRRYQNADGTWTKLGKERYGNYNPTNAFEKRTLGRIKKYDGLAQYYFQKSEKLKAKGKMEKAAKNEKWGNIVSKKAAKEDEIYKQYRNLSEEAQRRINRQVHKEKIKSWLTIPIFGGAIGGAIYGGAMGIADIYDSKAPKDYQFDKVDNLVKRYMDIDISDWLKEDS